MIFVGISENDHDSNISAFIDGTIKYAKYERQSGIKHAKAPLTWYFDTLKRWGIKENKIDGFAFTDPPIIISNGQKYSFPKNNELFLTKDELHPDGHGWNGFATHLPSNQYVMLDHHFAHIYSNPEYEHGVQAIATDGMGSDDIFCRLMNTPFIESMVFRDQSNASSLYTSPGKILNEIGSLIGLSGNEMDICGKLMGLQSYGIPDELFVNHFSSSGYNGTLYLNAWLRCLNENTPLQLDQETMNLVASVFSAVGETHKKVFNAFSKDEKILYSGGVALNVNWNRELLDDGYDLRLTPHSYDGGLSIGCLNYLLHQNGIKYNPDGFPYIQDDEAPQELPSKSTIDKVIELLADNKIVGWYQGHGEIGPRALGNRSILMNPSLPNGKNILNDKVKHREWWRPFGASVKQDKASQYFDLDDSPYMMYTSKVLSNDLPSITHVDGTCRHQTVTPEQNSLFYHLLDKFESKTGLPVLLNTSLNLGGKPIAGNMEDAMELFSNSEMDALCIGNNLYIK